MNNMFYIEGEPEIVSDTRKMILETFQDLEFYEDTHTYILNGIELLSASHIAHSFESRPFDAAVQSERYATRYGKTPEHWQREWKLNSFRAASLGTKTHEFGESLAYLYAGHPEFIRPTILPQYYKEENYLAPIHTKEEAAKKFLDELPASYHLVLNEARLYSGKNLDSELKLDIKICGTFDMLYYYDGEGDENKAGFVLFDYKTNKKLYNDFNRQCNIYLKYPFNTLYQEAFGEYTIQLNLYALMLEDIGLKLIERSIIWLKDDGTYERIPVENYSNFIERNLANKKFRVSD